MFTPRFTLIAAPHLFLLQDNQVLLSRRFQTGYMDGWFSVPAGHVDGSESVITAMIREAKEETGIELHREDLEFAHVMNRSTDRESCDFFFFCRAWQGNPTICEPEKCDAMEWFAVNKLPENTIGYIQSALELSLRGVQYSELGW